LSSTPYIHASVSTRSPFCSPRRLMALTKAMGSARNRRFSGPMARFVEAKSELWQGWVPPEGSRRAILGTQGPIYWGWVPQQCLLCGISGTHPCQAPLPSTLAKHPCQAPLPSTLAKHPATTLAPIPKLGEMPPSRAKIPRNCPKLGETSWEKKGRGGYFRSTL